MKNLTAIFSTPIGIYDLEKKLNKSELKYFSSIELSKNIRNLISIDGYILKNKKMNRLRKFFEESLKDYSKHTYDFKGDVELYITQSWINLSKPDEHHHKHLHPNSIISGVFYIDVDDEKDRIQFWKNSSLFRNEAFSFDNNEMNSFNSEMWWFPAITGRLYLFPSGLKHDVPPQEARTKDRTSLSFNTFVKGNLGNNRYKTELITVDGNKFR